MKTAQSTRPGVWAVIAGALLMVLGLWTPKAVAQEKVEVRAVAERSEIAPGERLLVAVVLDHGPELHSWPSEVIPFPPALQGMGLVQTSIKVEAPAGMRVAGIQWPAAVPYEVPNPEGDEPLFAPVYKGVATAFVVIETAKDLKAGEVTIPLSVRTQPCNDQTCFQPNTAAVSVAVKVAAAPSDARNEASLFSGFDQGKVTPTATAPPTDDGKSGSSPARTGGVEADLAAPADAQHSFLGFSIGGSIVILFLFAVLGGVVLNLTPCVLPIIPLKVMTLVQHAGTARRRVVLGGFNALGVVAFWTAVGLPMMFVSNLDPTRLIFGNWWVTLGLGLLIAVMGLGIMGLFSFNLPQSVYLFNPKADTARGSFMFGVMTGVLGLPCFGFVAGGLLAGAAALPPVVILAIFVGLGVGMAAPYFVLSVNPKLVERLPRTGPASDLVKQVMGFLLLAAAAFFVAVGIKTFLAKYPWYSNSISFWAAGFFVAVGGLWLIMRTFAISRSWARRMIFTVLAILPAWGTLLFAYSGAQADRKDYEARMAAGQVDDTSLSPGVWLDFNAARLERALGEGQTVVVDFTADWCLNCKFLKRTVLDRDPVRPRLDGVHLLEADVSLDNAPGWKELSELGQTGVPTLAIYGPGVEKPIVLNAYTPDAVLKAIEQASAKPLTQR